MKLLIVLLLAAALGIILYQRGVFSPAPPPPPPPPPPPAILSEPAPVIDETQMQKILKSARDPDADIRWEAVLFLDKAKSTRAMPLMREMLENDFEPTVRMKILDLLSNRHEPDAVQAVVSALNDREPEVRIAALKALEKMGDYTVAPQITKGPLHDPDEHVRLQAIKTLNTLQDQKRKEIEAARARYEAEKTAAAASNSKKQ